MSYILYDNLDIGLYKIDTALSSWNYILARKKAKNKNKKYTMSYYDKGYSKNKRRELENTQGLVLLFCICVGHGPSIKETFEQSLKESKGEREMIQA